MSDPLDPVPGDPSPPLPPPPEHEEEETDSPPSTPAVPLWTRLWSADELRHAREQQATFQQKNGPDLARALASWEMGRRLLDPEDPLPSGPTPRLALLLFRDAAFWTLRTLSVPGSSLHEQLPHLADSPLGSPSPPLRELLLGAPAAEEASRTPEELQAQAHQLRDLVRAWITHAQGPQAGIQRILVRRFWTVLALASVTVALLAVIVAGVMRLTTPPDLALGKPWQASSVYRNYVAGSRQVDGQATEIFFHTSEEQNPWVEFDLQRPTSIKSVQVKNRTDCCSERAVPLVIEISNDRQQWTEVARRNEDFRVWKADFAPRSTRYVRLRVLSRTWLHLEGVAIR